MIDGKSCNLFFESIFTLIFSLKSAKDLNINLKDSLKKQKGQHIMTDIPSQLSFEHMLSHLFPGFFTALTVFMIIDILSPLDMTQLMLTNLNAMLGFLGLVFLVGIILGVIIDGIHHRAIELGLFSFLDKKRYEETNKIPNYITTYKISNHIINQLGCEKDKCEKHSECDIYESRGYDLLKLFYTFDIDNIEKCVALYDYMKKSVYYYYEF